MSQTYFQATKPTGETKTYHAVLDEDAKRAAAEGFAGPGGTVEERRRDRMNMYVGPPVWGNDRRIKLYDL